VKRTKVGAGSGGMHSVRLDRPSGPIELVRPDGRVGRLTQPGQPERLVALARRPLRECLSEELRRLDADESYEQALAGLPLITRGRAPVGARK
jgi:glucose-6-phosphate dehydrogenase assembly protein OpcA